MPRKLNLKERQDVVQALWTAVNEGGGWLKELPNIVLTLIETGAWREREVDGRTISHKRFIDFITSPPRAGCGWAPDRVESLLKNKESTKALAAWRNAVTASKHVHHSDSDNITIIKDGRGTSRSYTVSRLERERPDLFAKVDAGEMSANTAAIEAGFRKKLTPFEQIVRLIPKLTKGEKNKIRGMLA